MTENDTIAAIATAPGRGGIGVVRISGPQLDAVHRGHHRQAAAAAPRGARRFLDARDEVIDQGIALYFPGAAFLYRAGRARAARARRTAGAAAVAQALPRAGRAPGPARRIHAPRVSQRQARSGAGGKCRGSDRCGDGRQAARSALRSLQGEFSQQIDELVQDTDRPAGAVEAALDFPDEEVEFLEHRRMARIRLAALRARLQDVLSASQQGSLLREGIHVVLAGQPNVGKSSLLNRLPERSWPSSPKSRARRATRYARASTWRELLPISSIPPACGNPAIRGKARHCAHLGGDREG